MHFVVDLDAADALIYWRAGRHASVSPKMTDSDLQYCFVFSVLRAMAGRPRDAKVTKAPQHGSRASSQRLDRKLDAQEAAYVNVETAVGLLQRHLYLEKNSMQVVLSGVAVRLSRRRINNNNNSSGLLVASREVHLDHYAVRSSDANNMPFHDHSGTREADRLSDAILFSQV